LDIPVFAQSAARIPGKNAAKSRRDKNMRRVLISCVMLGFALVAAHQATARPQSGGSGIVSGVVIGPDDKPVPHAIVTYQSGGGTSPHVAHADAKGRFTISKLRSDNYALKASGNGVSSSWENVAVRSGKTKTLTLHTIYAKEIPKAYTATRTYEPNN
jgi:Carboxypeptidase regulatory-like domain